MAFTALQVDTSRPNIFRLSEHAEYVLKDRAKVAIYSFKKQMYKIPNRATYWHYDDIEDEEFSCSFQGSNGFTNSWIIE